MSQEFQVVYSSTQPRTIVIKPLNKLNKIALVLEAVEDGSKVSARFQPATSLDLESKVSIKSVYGVIGVVQIDRGIVYYNFF